jgi:ATP-grasp in the biosynthetic pathway with Ter operon
VDRPLNVLIYPSGAECSLEVWHSLKSVVNLRVFGASSRSDHGDLCYADPVIELPNVQSPGFLQALHTAIVAHRIEAIFPCHDTVAEYLTVHRSEIPARVICSPAATATICRSKRALYSVFEPHGICPRVMPDVPVHRDFPVFAKPDVGEGGKGAAQLADAQVYQYFFAQHQREAYVVTEYLPGEEHTVDCFTDRHGELRFVGPRTRERIWAGISVRTRAVADGPFRAMATIINKVLALRGLWFFQTKRAANGDLKLLEVSTRVASSMGLHRARGVDLPLLALYDAFDHDVRLHAQAFPVLMDRALTPKFQLQVDYDTVYFDLDDTLIVRGRVNAAAIRLAYQCHAQGKQLVLITKHAHDPSATLALHHIAPQLFHRIVHLTADERKSDHVRGPRAIFIDNAYRERAEVHEQCGVPVFDVSAIEALIDHRE